MKNKKVLIPLILVFAVLITVVMILNGTIVLDRSAERGFENRIRWKGNEYVAVGGRYHEGKTIAKTKDGFNVMEVEEDESRTFLAVRSFLDNWLVVRSDYEIPKSGKITKAYWAYEVIEDEKFLGAIQKILTEFENDFEYDSKDKEIYEHTDTQNMKELYIAYEGCPVPTKYIGYMGILNGKWCLSLKDGRCYNIPEEYVLIFDEYLS